MKDQLDRNNSYNTHNEYLIWWGHVLSTNEWNTTVQCFLREENVEYVLISRKQSLRQLLYAESTLNSMAIRIDNTLVKMYARSICFWLKE